MRRTESPLDVEDAARELGVSKATVWRLIRSGRLASSRIGGRRRIPREAIGALLRHGTVFSDRWPPFTEDNPVFALLGMFRGRGPGSSADKHAVWRHPRRRRR